jgi:hypothetical protein
VVPLPVFIFLENAGSSFGDDHQLLTKNLGALGSVSGDAWGWAGPLFLKFSGNFEHVIGVLTVSDFFLMAGEFNVLNCCKFTSK